MCNKKIVFSLLLTLLLTFIFVRVKAQDNAQKRLTPIARSYEDKIVLRLVVNSLASLKIGSKSGYLIEKAIDNGDDPLLNYKPIEASPLRPMKNDSSTAEFVRQNRKRNSDDVLVGFAYLFCLDKAKSISKAPDSDIKKDPLLLEQEENEQLLSFHVACNRNDIAAKVVGLWAEDKDVKLGQKYIYRVRINDKIEDWEYIKVECKPFKDDFLTDKVKIEMNIGDSKLDFTFKDNSNFYAFAVDRSFENSLMFERQNNEPIMKLETVNSKKKSNYIYGDTNLVNYKRYFYKVYGYTPFGDLLYLGETDGTPKDLTPPTVPSIIIADHKTPKEVLIKWGFADGKPVADLKGFTISRSNKNESGFQVISKLLSPSTFEYTDENFEIEGQNYYTVEAIDTAGNTIKSFPAYVTLVDSTPPSKPIIKKAFIDAYGRISITLIPNIEKDFAGYQLSKANQRDHEYVQVLQTINDVTNAGNAIFTLNDVTTLNTLTPKIFYKVTALDKHYNQSEPSDIIELLRPDIIAPTSPVITDFLVDANSVTLNFVNSGSIDTKLNYLLRRKVNSANYDTIFRNGNSNIEIFTDFNIEGGQTYEYTMMAIDTSNLWSVNNRAIKLTTMAINQIPIPFLEGLFKVNDNKIIVSVSVKTGTITEGSKVEIYKKNLVDGEWEFFKSIALIIGNKMPTIEDSILLPYKNYFYIAKIVDKNKKESNFSNMVELDITK